MYLVGQDMERTNEEVRRELEEEVSNIEEAIALMEHQEMGRPHRPDELLDPEIQRLLMQHDVQTLEERKERLEQDLALVSNQRD